MKKGRKRERNRDGIETTAWVFLGGVRFERAARLNEQCCAAHCQSTPMEGAVILEALKPLLPLAGAAAGAAKITLLSFFKRSFLCSVHFCSACAKTPGGKADSIANAPQETAVALVIITASSVYLS